MQKTFFIRVLTFRVQFPFSRSSRIQVPRVRRRKACGSAKGTRWRQPPRSGRQARRAARERMEDTWTWMRRVWPARLSAPRSESARTARFGSGTSEQHQRRSPDSTSSRLKSASSGTKIAHTLHFIKLRKTKFRFNIKTRYIKAPLK